MSENSPEAEPDCLTCEAPIELDGGRVLSIRHAVPDDTDAAVEMYRRMEPSDLNRRFFTAGVPGTHSVNRWMSIEATGGLTLVAEVTLRSGDRRIVAEAGYAPTGDGDVELGIAVDSAYRGWLGRYMLSLLFLHAEADGVSNIQAVVLSSNRAMLGMAKSRGYVVLDHPDWGIVRLSMAADGTTPTWPKRKNGYRVVVETDHTRWRGEHALENEDYEVIICPVSSDSDTCPALKGERCPLLEGADAVVVDLASDHPKRTDLIKADQELHPELPLVIGSCTKAKPDIKVPLDEIVEQLSVLRQLEHDQGRTLGPSADA